MRSEIFPLFRPELRVLLVFLILYNDFPNNRSGAVWQLTTRR